MRPRPRRVDGAAGPAQHPKGTLAATILGSSLAFIDGSVVNVGLPAIERDLASSGASGASIGWLINAYLLPLGALVLLGGVAGDRYGRKRMFLAGLGLFTAASLACALAPGFGWLLAARAAQGVGAALAGAGQPGPARRRVRGRSARPRRRHLGAAGAITGALGPLSGGWLIDAVGWRSIFLVNLPVAALAGRPRLAQRRREPRRRDRAARCRRRAARDRRARPGDLGLTVLAARGGGGEAGPAGIALAALGAGVAALVAFVAVEARLGARAMMPLALFGTRSFVGVTLLTLSLYAALRRHGRAAALPAHPRRRLVGRRRRRGAAAAVGGNGPRLARRRPSSRERVGARILLTLGPLIVAAGFALFLRVGAAPVRYAIDLLPALVVIGCGLTLSVAPLTAAVMGAVDAAHVGSASGVNNATARVAGLLATALLGFVLAGDATAPNFIGRFHGAAIAGALLALAAGAAAFALVAAPAAAGASGSRGRPAPAPSAAPSARARRRS